MLDEHDENDDQDTDSDIEEGCEIATENEDEETDNRESSMGTTSADDLANDSTNVQTSLSCLGNKTADKEINKDGLFLDKLNYLLIEGENSTTMQLVEFLKQFANVKGKLASQLHPTFYD